MHVCGQTLVLVDNDATVSEVNQKLVKATLKYMFYHRPEDRTFCLNTYEHDITEQELYTDEVNDLVCAVDTMEFEAKDSNLADTLTEVITRWKEADFACRDIVVFTDGIEGAPLNHEREELNYLLANCEYPVYTVMLEQENNADAKKGLLSISVPSGGKMFESEFAGSDGAVDRQICEKIFAEMDGYAAANWGKYEEPEESEEDAAADATADGAEDTGKETGGSSAGGGPEESAESGPEDSAESGPEENTVSEYSAESENAGGLLTESRVIYERESDQGIIGKAGTVMLAASFLAAALIVATLGSFIIMKRKRAGGGLKVENVPDEEEFFDDYELKGLGTTELDTAYTKEDGDTVFLDEDAGATRILAGRLVTLTDTDDPGRMYRIMPSSPMSIGRARCDVVITGDDALSKRHCEIYEKDGDVHVRDLASSNGTRLNGVRISEERLSDGDELTIGAHTYKVGIV